MVLLALLHHKCGTVFTKELLRGICEREAIALTMLRRKDRTRRFPRKFRREGILFVENSNYEWLRNNVTRPYRGFHVVRDPRDVIVSGYFSHRYSHEINNRWGKKFLADHREWLSQVSFEEGLLKEIERGYALRVMSKWHFQDPDILELRFETLIADATSTLLEVFAHYELDVPRTTIEDVVAENSFQRLSGGREPGEVDPYSHFRSGVPGDWKNHFTPSLIDAFKARWGDLVLALGYEESQDW